MFRWVRKQIRALLPLHLVDTYRKWRYGRTWFDPDGRSVPTVFSEIYRRNMWGGQAGVFYSGPGSDPVVSRPYIEAVSDYIRASGIKSVVDIGCGDFRVGEQLLQLGI